MVSNTLGAVSTTLLLKTLRALTSFYLASENDPHEEHDYGSFDHRDREVWFKIDYFDLTLEQASQDLADRR
jgi:hypothetical protein